MQQAPSSFSLSLPGTLDALPELRDLLHAWLLAHDVVGSSADDLVLATWEACANAVEHPRLPSSKMVEIDACLLAGGVRIRVHDTGMWRENEPREDRGLGLTLIDELMDTATIRRARDGTDVEMFRSLAA